MKFNHLFSITLFLLISPIFLLANDSKSASEYTLPGILGSVSNKIAYIIEALEIYDHYGFQPRIRNRLIIHGPPGNGKTTLARKLTEKVKREFFCLDGPSIVDRYQGSGAERITQFFNDVQSRIAFDNKRAIIFIDEIDAIACNNEESNRADFKAALQQLWLEMDRYKDDYRIFIIVATNHFKKLDKTFLDRFGNNIIELKNPDFKLRKKVLKHFFDQNAIKIKPELLQKLTKNSDGLSIRSLEDLVLDLDISPSLRRGECINSQEIEEALRAIKAKFAINQTSDNDWKAKLERANVYLGIINGGLGSLAHLAYLCTFCIGFSHMIAYHKIDAHLINPYGIPTK